MLCFGCVWFSAASMGQVRTKVPVHLMDDGELDIAVHDAALRLIAPDGRETGYDPNGDDYYAIPWAAYNNNELAADDERFAGHPFTETLKVQMPIEGLYELMIYGGKRSEKYRVEISLLLAEAEEADAVLTGTTHPGLPTVYDFEVNSHLGAKIVATRVAQPTIHISFAPDVQRWVSIRSDYGWEISRPRDWDGGSEGIMGPQPCNHESVACGHIYIQQQLAQPGDSSPQAFLQRESQRLGNASIVSGGSTVIGGCPAYWVLVVPDERARFMPTLGAQKMIAVKRGNQIWEVVYRETGPAMRAIVGPSEWKFESTFEKIMSSVTFFDN